MRWKAKEDGWRRKFAWFPVRIGDEWLWLELYESMFMGEYSLVRTIDGGDDDQHPQPDRR